MCYIVFISHSLHWREIKIGLRKYVIILFRFQKGCQQLSEYYGKLSDKEAVLKKCNYPSQAHHK